MQLLAFSFGFKDAIDILLLAGILYYTYRLLRRTGAANLFWGILAFIVVWFLVTYVFQLDLTGALFDRIISVGAIALIVIFQEEIRMFFNRVGSRFSSVQLFRARNPPAVLRSHLLSVFFIFFQKSFDQISFLERRYFRHSSFFCYLPQVLKRQRFVSFFCHAPPFYSQ